MVSLTHLIEGCVIEEIVAAFSERPPGFELDVVTVHVGLGLNLLIEDVGFNLIDHGEDVIEFANINHPIR